MVPYPITADGFKLVVPVCASFKRAFQTAAESVLLRPRLLVEPDEVTRSYVDPYALAEPFWDRQIPAGLFAAP